MTDVLICWTKRWDNPIRLPADCRHGGPSALTINQRLEPHVRGQHRMAMDGSICMDCGMDTTGALSLRDGLALCMQEHGWHRDTAMRLYELAQFHETELWETSDRLPLWFAYAWDWPTARIKAALEAAAA